MILLADFMQACLDALKRRIAAAAANEFVVRAVLNNAPRSKVMIRSARLTVESRWAMINTVRCSAIGSCCLDTPFAFITSALVASSKTGAGRSPARANCNALALSTRQLLPRSSTTVSVALRKFNNKIAHPQVQPLQ